MNSENISFIKEILSTLPFIRYHVEYCDSHKLYDLLKNDYPNYAEYLKRRHLEHHFLCWCSNKAYKEMEAFTQKLRRDKDFRNKYKEALNPRGNTKLL